MTVQWATIAEITCSLHLTDVYKPNVRLLAIAQREGGGEREKEGQREKEKESVC